jgi:hypothetical protein
MDFCGCPESATLIEIIAEACGIDLNQIQRLGFQRRVIGAFTPVEILTLSAWQAFKTATDETKIVFTPMIGGDPIIEAGEAITVGGGDNSTLNGVEEVQGINPSKFSTLFKSLSPATEDSISKLMCEKNLTVYLFLQGGKIACWTPDISDVDADLQGIDIQSFFFSDRNNAGFGTKDTNTMSFAIPAGWSKKLYVFTPDFNPFTEL